MENFYSVSICDLLLNLNPSLICILIQTTLLVERRPPEDDDDDKGFFLRPELGETVGGAGKHEMFFTTTSAFSAERRFGRVKTDVGYGFRVRVWYSLRLGIQSLVREHVPYANVADGVTEDDVSIVRGKRRA
jgi:hypothetical protein